MADHPNGEREEGVNRWHCGMSNEELECLGCGEKLGCVRAGLTKCPFESQEVFEERREAVEAAEIRRSDRQTSHD